MNYATAGNLYIPHPDSEMALSASVWLGRDVYGKKSSELVAIDGLSALRRLQLVSTPVHYGFHATIKPLHDRGKGVAPLYSFSPFFVVAAQAYSSVTSDTFPL
jgi:hypothetical protein